MNPHITVAVNLVSQIEEILRDRKFWLFKNIVEDDLARQEIYRILGPYHNHRILSGRAYYHLPQAKNLRTLEILAIDDNNHTHNLSIRLVDTAEDAASLRDIVYIEDWKCVRGDSPNKPNSAIYYTPADCICIYISEKDIFGGGKTVYRAGFPYAQDDVDFQVSCPSLFVNAAIDDGSEIAGLMQKIAGHASALSASDSIGEQITRVNKLFSPEVSDNEYALLCKPVYDLLSPLYHYELNDVIAQLDIPQNFEIRCGECWMALMQTPGGAGGIKTLRYKKLATERYTMKTVDYYMKLPHKLEVIAADEGGFIACFPDLPGCITCGETAEAACANAIDAKRAWIEAALEEGIPIYEPPEWEDCCMTSPERNGVFFIGSSTDDIKPVSIKSMLADIEEVRRHKKT